MLGVFFTFALVLVVRAVHLQFINKEFYQQRGENVYLQTVTIEPRRGMLTDRNNEPLAISIPMSTVTANPVEFVKGAPQWPELARALKVRWPEMKLRLERYAAANKGFIYLKRHLTPEQGDQIKRLKLSGVVVTPESRRFYPSSVATAHLLGFTNVDDFGREGLEMRFEDRLRGLPGAKRVLRTRKGEIVEDVEGEKAMLPGEDIALSIDKRIQHVAYRELSTAVRSQKAHAGSMVIIDATTGEVLAMVNYPSYNPNNKNDAGKANYRNRVVTDLFEPGSTMKPFTIAAALEAGIIKPTTTIDTNPGYISVGQHTVRDHQNYGRLDVAGIIKKSSNIGTTKIALGLAPRAMHDMLTRVGFDGVARSGFPGEAARPLPDYRTWREFQQATISFGYGLMVNTLQLAQAYGVLANDGVAVATSLERRSGTPTGRRVMDATTAQQILAMLEDVVRGGTGKAAAIAGYRVAGKTGTVRKTAGRGYSDDHYRALFVGMLPGSAQKLVAAVVVDEPSNGAYYGGEVAAPVFASVLREVVRLLDIPPDSADPKQIITTKPPVITTADYADGPSQ